MNNLILPVRQASETVGERAGLGHCRDCRYRNKGKDKQVECRARSPQATIIMVPAARPVVAVAPQGPAFAPQIIACFPLIEDDWWCGEFRAKTSA